jgi:hypothetical protein
MKNDSKAIDLSRGSSKLAKAIRNRFFNLTTEEQEKLGNAMLGEIGEHIEEGESLAFLKDNPDGTSDLSIFGFNVREKKKKSKR